jgi:hypothetical protein
MSTRIESGGRPTAPHGPRPLGDVAKEVVETAGDRAVAYLRKTAATATDTCARLRQAAEIFNQLNRDGAAT